MISAATIIEVSVLLKVVEGAVVAGIGITIAFSLVIRGSVRASEYGRSGQSALALLHGLLAVIALAVSTAGIVYGLEILTSK